MYRRGYLVLVAVKSREVCDHGVRVDSAVDVLYVAQISVRRSTMAGLIGFGLSATTRAPQAQFVHIHRRWTWDARCMVRRYLTAQAS